mmetsp:Transcript_17899/g.20673  ORF Transcript_17899/g.20673 Transcript_17899/m.20673 type:complete len:91 (+) Transcript_17899:250-522(+)
MIWDIGTTYLDPTDFETLFDTYDVLHLHNISVKYLIDALDFCGVPDASKVIAEKYPEVMEEGTVNKVTFLYIIEEEHRGLGFAFKIPDSA